MPPLLAIEGLRLRTEADRQPLFDGVSLQLGDGERLLIEGPSGSGKSTLLRCLALLDARAEARVIYRGEVIAGGEVPRYRRRVMYLPQRSPAFSMTARESVARALALRGNQGGSAARTDELAGALGLEVEVLERRLTSLSGGEAQRVALLRALLLEPEVLLLDEPTSALDDDAATRAAEAVIRWADGGRAFVVVSHQRHPWAPLAERTVRVGADHRIAELVG